MENIISFDLIGFQVWLETFPSDYIIGYCQDSGTCPIAAWILSQGFKSATVQPDFVVVTTIDDQLFVEDLPFWVQLFIDHIDDLPAGAPVTRGVAITELNICREWRYA